MRVCMGISVSVYDFVREVEENIIIGCLRGEDSPGRWFHKETQRLSLDEGGLQQWCVPAVHK